MRVFWISRNGRPGLFCTKLDTWRISVQHGTLQLFSGAWQKHAETASVQTKRMQTEVVEFGSTKSYIEVSCLALPKVDVMPWLPTTPQINSTSTKAGVIRVISHDFSTVRSPTSQRGCPFKTHCKSITGIHGIFPEPVDILEGIEATKSICLMTSVILALIPKEKMSSFLPSG